MQCFHRRCSRHQKTVMKFILAFSALLVFSCNKDHSCHDCVAHDVAAKVVWEGDVAVDGCDWCIQTDSLHAYHPDALDSTFLYDGLPVILSYELTGEEFICGFGAHLPVIHITEIRE